MQLLYIKFAYIVEFEALQNIATSQVEPQAQHTISGVPRSSVTVEVRGLLKQGWLIPMTYTIIPFKYYKITKNTRSIQFLELLQ